MFKKIFMCALVVGIIVLGVFTFQRMYIPKATVKDDSHVTMGFVLQAENCKTVYFAGDTIWNDYVDDALARYNPEVIVLNTGYARVNDGAGNELLGGLIM